MPRIKIDLPERFTFATEIAILAHHVNWAGHVDNAQLVVLLSEARIAYFAGLGYTQEDVEGVGTIVADMAIQYVSEAFEGETVVFDMVADDFNKYGADLVCRVRDRDTGREIARAKIGFVFFDYATRRIAAAPVRFVERARAA